MADKQQNIFINYKFPMAEAEKASQILNRINQTNNLVQQGAQKTGQVLSSSYGKAGTSIEAMTVKLQQLAASIRLQNQGQAGTEKLVKQYHELKRAIDAANKAAFETPKAMKATGASVQSVTQQFGQLFTAVKLFITAGLLREVVDITLGMAELSGKAEGVERAFNRAFPDATKVLEDLREATHGAVTDLELMQRTLQATNLGVDVKALPQLFEFAAARAQQTGESVDYLVDSIVRGIGRKSLLVLDNLGISATRLKEELGGAALASQSVAKATEVVSKIAGEELAKMGGFAETSETQVKQLRVAFEELRLELAKKVESGGMIEFITEFFQDVGKLVKGHTKLVIEESKKAGVADAEIVLDRLKKLKATEQEKTDLLQQEVNSRVQIEGRYRDRVAEISKEIAGLGEEERTSGNSPRIQRLNQELQAAQSAVILTIESRKTLLAELRRLNKEEEVETTGIIERKKAQIESLQDQIEKTNNIADLGVRGRLTKALEIAQAELGDLQRAFSDIDPIKFVFEIDKATAALNKFIKEGEKVGAAEMADRFEEGLAGLAEMKPVPLPDIAKPSNWDIFWEDMSREWEENWRDVLSSGVDIQAQVLVDALQIEQDNLKRRLNALRDFYDEQQILAGDNERAKTLLRLREEKETTALQRKIFEKEKQTRRAQAVIDGAAGVVKAFATYPYPAAIIISALIAGKTIAEIRNINRQRSGYAKGVIDLQGPGTSTSDSIPVNVSRHESIMTARETFTAGDVLREVRAKKLDNKVLKVLKQGRPAIQQQFNDERIIKAIEKNRPPDVIEQSGIVYKATKKSDTYLNKIRAKSVRL